MGKQKCPKIRFNSFNDVWNSKQIENILKIKSGMSQKHIEVERGIYPILATGGEIGRTNTPIYDKESVLIGRKGTIDKPYYMNSPFWTVDTLFYSELSSDVAGFFVYSLFQRINWRHHNTSTGVPSLTSSVIHAIDVNIPDKVEQIQIGSFFQNLDQSIALHEKKLSQTQNLKKAMLEKMFPKEGRKQPEIRLRGFSGDWQVDAIGNVLQEVFRPINLDNETKYQLVTVKRRNGGIAEREILKGKDILVKSQFEVKAGDYIISKRQVVHGATGLVPHELDGSVVSNEYLVGQSTDKLNIEFFALLSTLPEMYKKFFLSSYGVDIEKLFFDVNDWKNREILLPCLAEQIQISKFFKQLDETLVLQQQQLQTLKNLKQAFLEKMFV